MGKFKFLVVLPQEMIQPLKLITLAENCSRNTLVKKTLQEMIAVRLEDAKVKVKTMLNNE